MIVTTPHADYPQTMKTDDHKRQTDKCSRHRDDSSILRCVDDVSLQID